MTDGWNLWHGCHKKSEGCLYCYVHRHDSRYGNDINIIRQNKSFNLPIERNKNGEYKIKSKTLIYTCFTSDFLLEDADEWRIPAWDMIRERSDCHFLFLTKRIERFTVNLPPDWGCGWNNVIVGCTCENQARADERLAMFIDLPIKHKLITCEPLLSAIDMKKYLLKSKNIKRVSVGGESGPDARVCDYEWILDIRRQCLEMGMPFNFRQTGAKLKKDGKIYNIPRKIQHSQARKAGINHNGRI